jgi:hypothetical protein
MINTLLYEIQIYANIFFCVVIIVYSLVYLKAHVEEKVWSAIKIVYIIVALLWGMLYISIAIDTTTVWLSNEIRLGVIRPLITFTLASLAAGAVLRVRAVGIDGKWWHIIFKSKNVNHNHIDKVV